MLTGSATAARTPGWRIDSVVFQDDPVIPPLPGDLIADSASDAWAMWYHSPYPYVGHWTRGAWHDVTMPKSLTPGLSVVAFGASSPRNVWVFQEYPSNVAVRYNGTHWLAQSMPSWVVDDAHASDNSVDAVAAGSSSVWVFNTYDRYIPGSPQDHYASWYNGRGWTRTNLPGVPYSADALATNDVWVLGATVKTAGTRQPVWIMMHWNGKSWSSAAIPLPKIPKGATLTDDSLVAVTSRNFWIEQLVTNPQRVLADYLMNWNGKRWQRVSPPVELGPLAEDGYGGIWTAAGGSGTHYHFYHYSAGHWTRYMAPVISYNVAANPQGLAWIPGGRSMWAWDSETLSGEEPSSTVGVIFRYGP
ncbi:MAG: hypothetical protein JO242_05505 [Streptosporangiaceae bacterium]|nr:hypothetical protein [Streptosporangiaceae bacterium]